MPTAKFSRAVASGASATESATSEASFQREHALARDVATEAGHLLLQLRTDLSAAGASIRELRDAGDARANDLILRRLSEAFPGDPVLSEESRDDGRRLDAERVWIVDPLDGTREFGEPGRRDWAVHIAFWSQGQLVAGAVALPAEDLTLSTASPPPPPPPHDGPVRLLVSRSRPPAVSQTLAARLGGVLVPLGSAGAKAMAVVRGEADVYAHAGGQFEWDSAAPVVVAAAAGLHTSRLDGSPLRYNQPDVYLPDLLICRPELAEAVLDGIAAHA